MYPLKNGSYANHTNVKSNTLTIVQHLKKIGYEVGLAGKDHVGPMQTFNFDFHIKKIENKNLDLFRIKKYLKNIDNPFCLILASDYPHGPHPSISSYKVSDIIKHPYDFRVNPKKTGYYEFIKNDDIQLTSILKIIDDSKLAENSVFIYMADHGYSGKFTLYQKGIKWTERHSSAHYKRAARAIEHPLFSITSSFPYFLLLLINFHLPRFTGGPDTSDLEPE